MLLFLNNTITSIIIMDSLTDFEVDFDIKAQVFQVCG